MRRKPSFLVLLCFVFAFAACTDLPDDGQTKPEPTPEPETASFDWKVISSLNLSVSVPTLAGDINNYSRIIQVYTADTFEPTTLIATGVARPGQPFRTSLTVPTAVSKLFFLVKDASARTKTYAADISDKQTELTLDISNLPEYSVLTRSDAATYEPEGMPEVTIPSKFDHVIETSFPEKLEDGKTYYIPKGKTVTINDKLPLNNGKYNRLNNTIYVAGKLVLNGSAGKSISGRSFYILDGGSLEADSLTFIQGSLSKYADPMLYVGQGASVKVNTNIIIPGGRNVIINGGSVICKNYSMNDSDGHLHVLGLLSADYFATQWSKLNYVYVYPFSLLEGRSRAGFGSSEITMHRDAIVYSGQKLDVPNCHFFVPDNEKSADGKPVAFLRFENTGFLDECQLRVSEGIEVYAPSMTYKKYYTKLKTCLEKGAFLSTDLTERKLYIGTGEHNYNKGYGTFEIIDNDDDGVPNNMDEDDDDASVVASSTYPGVGEFATLMFEDLWPNKGDYDMNDIVTDINVSWITNADNYVNQVIIHWKPRAAGTTKNVGMAVQFDKLSSGEIKSVSSTTSIAGNAPFAVNKGVEQGVSKAIVPFFNNISDVLYRKADRVTINTNPNDTYSQPQLQRVTIEFNTPVSMADVNIDQLNFFIVVDQRDHEIHLSNYKQTEKGKVLNAENNGLDPNNNYMTEDGMMWGLMVPKSIAYPKEGKNIEEVYKNYKKWYQSNGTEAKDWYEDKSGYINKSESYDEPDEIPEKE